MCHGMTSEEVSRTVTVIRNREYFLKEMTLQLTIRGNNTCNFINKVLTETSVVQRGTAVAQWLRCGATNRKVAGSIPDGVIGIFH